MTSTPRWVGDLWSRTWGGLTPGAVTARQPTSPAIQTTLPFMRNTFAQVTPRNSHNSWLTFFKRRDDVVNRVTLCWGALVRMTVAEAVFQPTRHSRKNLFSERYLKWQDCLSERMRHLLLTAAAHNRWLWLEIRQRSGHTASPAHLVYTCTALDCHILGPRSLNTTKHVSLKPRVQICTVYTTFWKHN